MKVNRRIPDKYMPPRLPGLTTAVTWLVLERVGAPGWVWGVLGTLLAVVWVGSIYAMYTADFAEPIFKEPK